ncbi:MAG: translation initiation factor IF-3 [Bacteroidaceae bacterium]|jgi:translation initiation factor IF-3|nr:translation initiation factor IF-3 [Bacteroidaceae bacterium]
MKGDNKKQKQLRINEQIRAREVRIVGDDIESAVIPTKEALRLAEEREVDLVEISPTANPPVCRLIDYSKYLYQQKKKAKEIKAKQTKVEVKEIRFGPQTGEADYAFKLKHAQEFLTDGNKVKAYVFFKGRSIVFKEQGEVLLLRFANDLEDLAKVESMPNLEGKRMFLTLAPKKAGQPKKSQQKRDNEAAEAQAKTQAESAKQAEGPNPNSPFAGLADKLAEAEKTEDEQS